MGKPARLITIPFSHYCEKARWALDHAGLPYVEEKYVPGLHFLGTVPAGGRTVPVLVTRHGALTDSAKILAFADAHAPVERRLYPREEKLRAEVDAIERALNEDFGPAIRLFGYFHMLPAPRTLASVVGKGYGLAARLALPYATPLVAPLIRRKYRVDAARAEQARGTVRRLIDEMSLKLRGRRYFVGDRFTAADLTFAAIAAPGALPPEHPAWTDDAAILPEAVRAFVEEFRASPAGEHVLAMYREHRQARPPA